MRGASRFGRFTSTTRSLARVSALVRVAPNEFGAFHPDLTVSAHPGQQGLGAAAGGGNSWELSSGPC
jgi:hypothetical protein